MATIIPAAADNGIPIASRAGESPSRISATLLTWKPGINPVREPMHTPINSAKSIQPISTKNVSKYTTFTNLQHHRQFHFHLHQLRLHYLRRNGVLRFHHLRLQSISQPTLVSNPDGKNSDLLNLNQH